MAKIVKQSWMENGYRHHVTIECEECHTIFELDPDSMGEDNCQECGAVYNSFGQRLKGYTQAWPGQNEYGEYFEEDY